MMRASLAVTLALLAMAPAAAQRARTAMGPVPIGDPASWLGPDDYPPDAIRSERQGRVVAALTVDATGQVKDCRIDTSNGTESIDAKTCEVLLARARFNPATDRRGRPTSSSYKLPVRWVVPDQPADGARVVAVEAMPDKMATEVEVSIDPQGNITGCRLIARIAGGADPCATMTIGTPWAERFTKNGLPVAVVVRQRFSRSLVVAPAP